MTMRKIKNFVITTLAGLLVIGGFLLIAGAAGGVDQNLLTVRGMITYCAVGFAMIGAGWLCGYAID